MEFLLSLDSSRLIFIILLFLSFLILCSLTRRYLFVTLVYILFILPFNITLQLHSVFGLETSYIKGSTSSYLIPTLSLLDCFVFFLLLVFFLKGLIKGLFYKEKVFFVLLFIFLFLKIIIDFNFLSTLLIFRLYIYSLAGYLLFKYLFIQYKLKKNEKRVLFYTICFSVFIQFAISFSQFLYGTSLGLYFLGESTIVKGMYGSSFIDLGGQVFLRAYGTFPHPNLLAGYMLFALFFFIFVFKDKIKYVFIFISLLTIILTFSRIVIFLSLVLLVFLLFAFVFEKVKSYSFVPLFFSRFYDLGHSFSDRLELARNSFEVIKNHLYFGIGAGKYVYGVDYYPVYTNRGFLLLEPVHNIYLLFLSEYGLVFGIPVILFILFILIKGFITLDIYFKYFILVILIISFLDHYFITLPQGLLMFVFALSMVYVMSLAQSFKKDC